MKSVPNSNQTNDLVLRIDRSKMANKRSLRHGTQADMIKLVGSSCYALCLFRAAELTTFDTMTNDDFIFDMLNLAQIKVNHPDVLGDDCYVFDADKLLSLMGSVKRIVSREIKDLKKDSLFVGWFTHADYNHAVLCQVIDIEPANEGTVIKYEPLYDPLSDSNSLKYGTLIGVRIIA